MTKTLLAGLLIAPFACFSQPVVPDELKQQIRLELHLEYHGAGKTLQDRLGQIAAKDVIAEVLLETMTRNSRIRTPGIVILELWQSIDMLAIWKDKRAMPILLELAQERPAGEGNKAIDRGLRVRALTAIGQIDPVAGKGVLLGALSDPDPGIRRAAAPSLAKIDDPDVFREIEVQASRERDPGVFRELQALADAGRLRLSEGSVK
jgi:hypothetical protein